MQKDKRIMVHLVNYRRGNRLANIPVDLALEPGRGVSSVRVVSPDREGPRAPRPRLIDYNASGRSTSTIPSSSARASATV